MSKSTKSKYNSLPLGLAGYCTNQLVEACERGAEYNKPRGGTAVYCAISDKLEVIKLFNTACVAEIMNMGRYKHKPIAVVYNLKYHKDLLRKRLLEYLVERSFLKDCFILKEHFNVDAGVVVSNCYMPQNYLGIANNVLRLGCENARHCLRWNKMVEAGVDEDLAFVLCGYTVSCLGDIVSFVRDCRSFSHSILCSCDNKRFVDTLLGNRTLNDCYEYNEQYLEVKRYHEAWDDVGGGRTHYFKNLCKDKLQQHHITTEPEFDLMGFVVTPSKSIEGYKVSELNELWESLREK